MTLLIILIFLVAPILEIYVLITAGGTFGALPVIGACLFTAILGGIILRIQGIQAIAALQKDLNQGRAPTGPIADGVFLILAAPFLMTPGFLTDGFGFLLLVPPFRRMLAKRALTYLAKKADLKSRTITIRRSN
ncbi:MAG: FxsA family protein [Pseudomonadota bacterium]